MATFLTQILLKLDIINFILIIISYLGFFNSLEAGFDFKPLSFIDFQVASFSYEDDSAHQSVYFPLAVGKC